MGMKLTHARVSIQRFSMDQISAAIAQCMEIYAETKSISHSHVTITKVFFLQK